jgi:hypothetical protein
MPSSTSHGIGGLGFRRGQRFDLLRFAALGWTPPPSTNHSVPGLPVLCQHKTELFRAPPSNQHEQQCIETGPATTDEEKVDMKNKAPMVLVGMLISFVACGGTDDDSYPNPELGRAPTADSGGSTADSGGSTAGSGGSTADSGGSTAGSGGSTAGSGGSTADSDGGTNTAPDGGTAPDIMKTVTSSSVTLSWLVRGDFLDVKLSAPTTGWVAVGWNPSNRMKDADIQVGFVSGGDVKIRDDFGTSQTRHESDESLGGKSNVINISGSESGGTTQLAFTIPLSSGDRYDTTLSGGQNVKVILAYGAQGADDFDSYHAGRGFVEIKL